MRGRTLDGRLLLAVLLTGVSLILWIAGRDVPVALVVLTSLVDGFYLGFRQSSAAAVEEIEAPYIPESPS